MRENGVVDKALDILFPRRCLWCGRVIGFTACEDCSREAEAQRLPAGSLDMAEFNAARLVSPVWACFAYEPPASTAVLRLKFSGGVEAAADIGAALAEKYEKEKLANCFDLVVPVPVSRRTLRERGYSQTLLVARRFVKLAGLPVAGNVLVKQKETRRQMDLDRQERLTNVTGAYSVKHREKVAGKRVLLLDDIITTGSTLNECAKTLLEAGAKSCAGICFAATAKDHAHRQDTPKRNK